MNKIGLHFNYWNGTGLENDIRQCLELTARVGADVFEYGTGVVLGMSHAQRRELRQAISDRGLISSINGGAAPDLDMASGDPAFRRKSLDFYKKTVEAIAEMDSPIWSGVNYSRWLRMPEDVLDYDKKQAVRELALESVREFALALQEFQVTCCFEIVNRYEQFVLNTAAEGVQFVNQINNPYAKLLLDTFHMSIEEDNIAAAIVFAMENRQLGHIHLGESNRRLPGIGPTNLNWPEIFGAIKKSGYAGFLTLEPLVMMGTPLAQKVRVWRDLTATRSLDALADDARRSIEFVRNQLKN